MSGTNNASNDGGNGDEGTPPPAPTPPPPPAPAPNGGDDETRVNNLVAEASNKAEARAKREQAKAAGFDTVAEFDTWVASAREKERAELSETDRLKAEADEAKRERDEARREAATVRARGELQAAFVEAEVNPKRLATAMKLALADVASGDAADISAAVEAVKTESPEWFEPNTSQTPPPAPNGNGTPPAPRRGPSPQPGEKTPREIAEEKRAIHKAKRRGPKPPA